MIKKIIRTVKRDGIFKTLKKVLRYIKYKILTKKKKNIIKDYVDINQFSTIIIFENNFGWNKIMKQRPQQIAEGLPDNTLIFYHTHEESDFSTKIRINKIKDNLVLIDLGYFRESVIEELSEFSNKYMMIYSTDYIPYERIKLYKEYGYEIIYEYVDDINEDLSGKDMYKLLMERHKKLEKDEPFAICTANELYIKSNFKYSKLITNGADYEHFKPQKYEMPNDLKELRDKYKYLICYYGALASWFDYELIKRASKNKEYCFVLLGVDYDNTLDKSNILKSDNVYYLGKKDYRDLPKYGYYMDLFIIPFVINDITKSTSPVKIFEYMAMEKPIITTALPECKKYKSVLYSNSHEEFINNLNEGIKLINKKEYKKLLQKEAKENTWISKSKEMIEFINESKQKKAEEKIDTILKNEKYERIVVWRSPFGWNVPLFQRPQHIARQLAKQKCLVFYEVTTNTDKVRTIKKEEDNLYLVNFENCETKRLLSDKLKLSKKSKYLQIYSTNWSMSLEEMKDYEKDGFKVLYEYIDDISPELAGTDELPEYIVDKYEYALKNKKTLIVTTANELYNDVKNKRGNKNLILSCNGVDYNFFKTYDNNFKYEKQFKSLIKNGKVNLCYYGALATWFDYELIRKIDKTNKYNIILFGIKYDGSYDKSKIDKLENVHFLGAKDYNILKYYSSKMDILMIPFVINSITQATSPLKLFEYMALQKPIVTTAMNECKNYKSVLIGNTHEEFIKKLAECEILMNDKKYLSLLDKEAKDNDWSKKAKLIVDLLKESESTKK